MQPSAFNPSPLTKLVGTVLLFGAYAGIVVFLLPLMINSPYYANPWLRLLDGLLLFSAVTFGYMYVLTGWIRVPLPRFMPRGRLGALAVLSIFGYMMMLTFGLVLILAAFGVVHVARGKSARANTLLRKFTFRS